MSKAHLHDGLPPNLPRIARSCAELRVNYAICLRNVCVILPTQIVHCLNLRNMYVMSTQCLRNIYAIFTECLRNIYVVLRII